MNIIRQCSQSHTSHQNGVAERKNRSLMDKARSMAFENKIPAHLWPEAISTANYLINRTATRTNAGTTPYEKLTGIKPSLHHLRVFGCRTFVLNTNPSLTKWAPRSTKCIFLGYDSTSRGFGNYHRGSQKILISKDVEFDELTFPCQPQSSVLANSGNHSADSPLWPNDIIELHDKGSITDPACPVSTLPHLASPSTTSSSGAASQVQRIDQPKLIHEDQTLDPHLSAYTPDQRHGAHDRTSSPSNSLSTTTGVPHSPPDITLELELALDASHLANVPLFTYQCRSTGTTGSASGVQGDMLPSITQSGRLTAISLDGLPPLRS